MKDEPKDVPSDQDRTEQDIWNELEASDDTAPPDEDAAAEEQVDQDDDISAEDSDGSTSPDDDAPDLPKTDEEPEPVDLEAQNKRLETELKRQSNRTSALQRKVNALQAELERKERPPPEDDNDTTELDSIAEEYEDVAGPLVKQVRKLQGRLDDLSATGNDRAEQAKVELEAIEAEQMDALMQEHPDGLNVIRENSDVFVDWIEDQPKKFRDIFERNREFLVDGTGAALLINRFKAALGEDEPKSDTRLQNRRQKQLAGAKSAPAGRKAAAPAPLEALDDDQAIWDYYEREDRKAAR